MQPHSSCGWMSSLQGGFGRCWAEVIADKQVQWKELIQQNSLKRASQRALPKRGRAAGAEQITLSNPSWFVAFYMASLKLHIIHGHTHFHYCAQDQASGNSFEGDLHKVTLQSGRKKHSGLCDSHWEEQASEGATWPFRLPQVFSLMVMDFTLKCWTGPPQL